MLDGGARINLTIPDTRGGSGSFDRHPPRRTMTKTQPRAVGPRALNKQFDGYHCRN